MGSEYILGKELIEQRGLSASYLTKLVREGLQAYQGINCLPVHDINKLKPEPYFRDEGEADSRFRFLWSKDRASIEDEHDKKIKDIIELNMQIPSYRENFFSFPEEEGVLSSSVLEPLLAYKAVRAPEGSVAVDFNENQPVQDWYFLKKDITKFVGDVVESVVSSLCQDDKIALCFGIVEEGKLNGVTLRGNKRRNILSAALFEKGCKYLDIFNEVKERSRMMSMSAHKKTESDWARKKYRADEIHDWWEAGYRLLKEHGIELERCAERLRENELVRVKEN